MKTGYKVVIVRNGLFTSLTEPAGLSVTYRPGEDAYPSLGYLFVFTSKQAAIEYGTHQRVPVKVWECEYQPSPVENVNELTIPLVDSIYRALEAYWGQIRRGQLPDLGPGVTLTSMPRGTDWAERVRLTKRVADIGTQI